MADLPEPLRKLDLQPYSRAVLHFTADWMRDRFDLNPPYQRGTVWDLSRRSNLIRSLLLGIPIGNIVLNHRGFQSETIFAVVDGKQRIETMRRFVDGEFTVPAHWFSEQHLESGVRTGEASFADLSVIGRRYFENLLVPAVEANVSGIGREAEIFRLINTGGVEQDAATLARAAELETS